MEAATRHGPILLAATAATPTDYTPYLAEIRRLQGALAAHTGSYQLAADESLTCAPHTFLAVPPTLFIGPPFWLLPFRK